MKNVWQNCHTTISLWPPTNSGAKISASFTGFRICKNTCTFFGGLGSHRPIMSQKSTTIGSFTVRVRFEIWALEYQKSIFFSTFGLFGTWYEKLCMSFLWKTNSYFICGQASMLNLDMKINFLFKSKCAKIDSFHQF